jgi:hypothetical protein
LRFGGYLRVRCEDGGPSVYEARGAVTSAIGAAAALLPVWFYGLALTIEPCYVLPLRVEGWAIIFTARRWYASFCHPGQGA